MGRIISKAYPAGTMINGVLLGEPVIVTASGDSFKPGDSMNDLWFAWDDPRIPNGSIDIDGNFIVDEFSQ